MKWSNLATILCTAAAGLLVFAMPSQAGVTIHSEAADTDFVGECATATPATADAAVPGGLSCFGTTVFISGKANILYIEVHSAGDTHDGAALLLGCRIRPASTGVWSFCNPFGSGAAPGFYLTENKMAAPTANTNCNDGGGGPGDCHDNSIEQTWCVPIDGNDTFDIDVRIATSTPGAIAFMEASTFLVKSTKLKGQCGAGDSSATTPF